MEQVACPVKPDAHFGGPVEVVIFLESEFTVGTSRELQERALDFIALKFQPHYGAPVRFIEAPGWAVQPISKLTRECPNPAQLLTLTIPQKLTQLEALGEPLRLAPLDPKRHDFEYELALRTDRNDMCGAEVDFLEEPDWWLVWQIIGALVSGAVDRGDLQGRDELLEAARVGLDEVIDVRLRQFELVGAR